MGTGTTSAAFVSSSAPSTSSSHQHTLLTQQQARRRRRRGWCSTSVGHASGASLATSRCLSLALQLHDGWINGELLPACACADFKYGGGGDSVLVVDREAFDSCDATEPVARYADGATTVPLDRPGFFCFISGAPGHCGEGQKLIVRVMVHPAETPALTPALATSPVSSCCFSDRFASKFVVDRSPGESHSSMLGDMSNFVKLAKN